MAATLISATGSWGIANQESSLGVIIEGIDEDSRMEINYQKDNQGQRTGAACYDDSIEVKVSGKIMAANGFSGKMAANLTLANAISSAHLLSANAGRVMIKGVKRTSSNEDWKGVEIEAEALPYFS